jgi:hypothetical protein
MTNSNLVGCSTGNPAIIHALHTYVIRVMAERINFASRVIGALKR